VLGGLLSVVAIYHAARFWWYARGFEVPFRYFLYSAWLLPAGLLILIAAARFRNGGALPWILVLLAGLWTVAVLVFEPHGYTYFPRVVPQ